LIDSLARRLGIGDGYHDYRGSWVSFTLEAKTLILQAMGFSLDQESAIEGECRRLDALEWRSMPPRIATAHGRPVRIT
jgi:hypothetical protein